MAVNNFRFVLGRSGLTGILSENNFVIQILIFGSDLLI